MKFKELSIYYLETVFANMSLGVTPWCIYSSVRVTETEDSRCENHRE